MQKTYLVEVLDGWRLERGNKMKVYLSPQVNPKEKIIYSFDGEVITATLNGMTDTFDFTDMPIGVMDGDAETTLPVSPIVSAERKEDGLYVKLLNFIAEDAPYEDCFPEWKEV
jgi:hypothetical protein